MLAPSANAQPAHFPRGSWRVIIDALAELGRSEIERAALEAQHAPEKHTDEAQQDETNGTAQADA
jgi:hypothetical protein